MLPRYKDDCEVHHSTTISSPCVSLVTGQTTDWDRLERQSSPLHLSPHPTRPNNRNKYLFCLLSHFICLPLSSDSFYINAKYTYNFLPTCYESGGDLFFFQFPRRARRSQTNNQWVPAPDKEIKTLSFYRLELSLSLFILKTSLLLESQ